MPDALQDRNAQLEKQIMEWADAVYDEAERELGESREVRLCAKLIDYIAGQQWSSKARFGRSRPVVNRNFRQFMEMAGLLTDIEPDFTVKFPNFDDSLGDLQDLLNEMVPMWARNTDFEGELTQAVMWALVGSTAFAKIFWSCYLNGGMGDVNFLPLSLLNCMTIGAGNRLQEDECVIARWPVTIEALYRTYDESLVDAVIPDLESGEALSDMMRPGKISEGKWAVLPPQLKKLLGIKRVNQARRSRYPRAMLKQFWFRDRSKNETNKTVPVGDSRYNWSYMVEPGMPFYPRGRFIVMAGGKILSDGANPFWHAMFPFAKLRLLRVPWSSHGLTPLDSQASMSDVINRINGGIMDMIRSVIEPKIVAPKSAFAQSVWDSLDPGAPGAKVMYNNNAPKGPEYPKPAELPMYVLSMKQDVEKEQDLSSGAAAISQAVQKKQVPGGDSLEMILNSRSIPIRFMGRGMHSFLTEVGIQVVSLKMQFENAKSRIAKFGARGLTDADFEPYYGQFLNKGMEPEKFVRGMTFEIRKGSLLAIEKQEEVQIGVVLRKMGDISRRALLRKMGLTQPQIEKIEQELIVELQQKAAIAAAMGGGQAHHKK